MGKNINQAKARKFQERATGLFLVVGTLVLAAVLSWVLFSKIALPVLGTQLRLMRIYDDISFCEQQREVALETNRGMYATEMDESILELYGERDSLVHSDQFWVAFSAKNHVSFFAVAFGLSIVALIAGMWFALLKVDGVFLGIVKFERISLILIINFIFGFLLLIFSNLTHFCRAIVSQMQCQINQFPAPRFGHRVKAVRKKRSRHQKQERVQKIVPFRQGKTG